MDTIRKLDQRVASLYIRYDAHLDHEEHPFAPTRGNLRQLVEEAQEM